jgi:hypothetical protein
MLSLFDIYAKPITLNYNKKSVFSTTYSSIISIIIIVLFLASISYFSRILFEKINPEIRSIITYPDDMEFNTTLNNDNFSIYMSFDKPIENIEQYFKINPYLWDLGKKDVSETLQIIDCTELYPKKFTQRNKDFCFENKQINLVYDLKEFNVDIFKCRNEEGQEPKCRSEEEIDKIMKTSTFGVQTFTEEQNLNDYVNPLVVIFYSYFRALENDYKIQFYLTYELYDLITDDGLVFENSKKNSTLVLADTYIDVYRRKKKSL